MTIEKVAGFPASGRARQPMLPEAAKLLEAIVAGSTCRVHGKDSEKVIRQVRAAVIESGRKLRTRSDVSTEGAFFVAIKP